jgi:hypothetical protein
MKFETLEKELNKMDSDYEKETKRLKKALDKIKQSYDEKFDDKRSLYFAKREPLRKKIQPLCPHKDNIKDDDFHPHKGEGGPNLTCKICGYFRYI